MYASQRARVDVNDFGSIGKKTREFRGNAQHTVVAVFPNHFTLAHQPYFLTPNIHLDRKVHAQTRLLRQFRFKINAGGADVAGQALNAADLVRQLGIKSISAPRTSQR